MHNYTYIISLLLLFFACNQQENISGCLDIEACNYNADVTEDDETCEYVVDCEGICGGDSVLDECGECGGDGSSCSEDWSITLAANTNGWGGVFPASDINNQMGMNLNASDGYDSDYDIPEPPSNPTNYISLYFPHPEWNIEIGGMPSENFTSDIRALYDYWDSYIIWEVEVISDMTGVGNIYFSDFSNIPDNLVIELIYDDQTINISDGTTIEIMFQTNTKKEFIIKVSVN